MYPGRVHCYQKRLAVSVTDHMSYQKSYHILTYLICSALSLLNVGVFLCLMLKLLTFVEMCKDVLHFC